MIIRMNKEAKDKVNAFTKKTGTVNNSVAVNNVINGLVGLDRDIRHYLYDACIHRYDELNSIDVEDGDIEKDMEITEKLRQLLYASFIFKENEPW